MQFEDDVIVVPIFNQDHQVVAVLDIDIEYLSTFDATDKKLLEEAARLFITYIHTILAKDIIDANEYSPLPKSDLKVSNRILPYSFLLIFLTPNHF